MIENIKIVIKEHKGLVIAGVVAVVLFIIASIAIVQVRGYYQAKEIEEQTRLEQENKTDDNAKKADQELSSSQKEKIANYSEEIKEVLATLKANIWNDSSEKAYIKFGENYFLDGKKEQYNQSNQNGTPFVVLTLYKQNLSEVGASGTLTSIAIEQSDGKKGIINLKKIDVYGTGSGANNKTTEYAISSDLFSSSNSYTRTSASDYINVVYEESKIGQYCNNRFNDLETVISEWCSLNQPSVTEVTFGGVVSVDYTINTNILEFYCNNKSATEIQVFYKFDEDKLYINEGGQYATS